MTHAPRPDRPPLSEAAGLAALLRAHLERTPGPRFEALADALRHAISSGAVGRGARLPSERDLAGRTGLGRETVGRAYGLLRREGWAQSRTGSGTFAAHPTPSGPRRWMRDVVDADRPFGAEHPQTINLTVSKPEPIGERLREAGEAAARRLPALARETEYATQGLPALRERIAERFARRGLPTSPHQILVTTGAQQALNLIAQLHVRPGAPVLTESPTYLGAIDAFRLLRGELVGFDPLGADAEAQVAEAIAYRQPSLVFTMATCHTVTGQAMPVAVRRTIATAAEAHQVPVIDDDIFAGLTFETAPAPPIAAYAEDAPVYVVGSMSKLAWNGLRVGWLRAPEALVGRITRLKGTDDLGTSLVAQLVADELLAHEAELADLRRAEARRACDDAAGWLADVAPEWRWSSPQGGRSLWIRLPDDGPSAAELARTARRFGVLIAPGDAFAPDQRHRDRLRLMPVQADGDLREGIRRLGRAWAAHREPNRPAAGPLSR